MDGRDPLFNSLGTSLLGTSLLGSNNLAASSSSQNRLRFSSRRITCPSCQSRRGFSPLIGDETAGKCFSCDIFIPPKRLKVSLAPTSANIRVPLEQPQPTQPIDERHIAHTEVNDSLAYLDELARQLALECSEDEERAAIYEYMAGMSREEAERLARVNDPARVLAYATLVLRDIHPFAATLIELTHSRSILTDAPIGMTTDGATIFWYRNHRHEYVNAKKVYYTGDGFSRDKAIDARFLYSRKDGYGQCLYGEEQLSPLYVKPDGTRYTSGTRVVLVESEKSALIARYRAPGVIWLATGGANGLTREKCLVLRSRNVTLLYDRDAAGERGAHSALSTLHSLDIHADALDQQHIFRDRKDGYDIADRFYENAFLASPK